MQYHAAKSRKLDASYFICRLNHTNIKWVSILLPTRRAGVKQLQKNTKETILHLLILNLSIPLIMLFIILNNNLSYQIWEYIKRSLKWIYQSIIVTWHPSYSSSFFHEQKVKWAKTLTSLVWFESNRSHPPNRIYIEILWNGYNGSYIYIKQLQWFRPRRLWSQQEVFPLGFIPPRGGALLSVHVTLWE